LRDQKSRPRHPQLRGCDFAEEARRMSKAFVVILAIGIAVLVAGVGHYHRYPAARTTITSP
jgi:hypothetical protein